MSVQKWIRKKKIDKNHEVKTSIESAYCWKKCHCAEIWCEHVGIFIQNSIIFHWIAIKMDNFKKVNARKDRNKRMLNTTEQTETKWQLCRNKSMWKCHMNMAARTEMYHESRNNRPQLLVQGRQKWFRNNKKKGYGATMATGKQQKPKIYVPNGFKQNQCVDWLNGKNGQQRLNLLGMCTAVASSECTNMFAQYGCWLVIASAGQITV